MPLNTQLTDKAALEVEPLPLSFPAWGTWGRCPISHSWLGYARLIDATLANLSGAEQHKTRSPPCRYVHRGVDTNPPANASRARAREKRWTNVCNAPTAARRSGCGSRESQRFERVVHRGGRWQGHRDVLSLNTRGVEHPCDAITQSGEDRECEGASRGLDAWRTAGFRWRRCDRK